MPQDGFTIRYIASELDEKLKGGKISKIFQPARDELSFIIYTAEGNVKLDAGYSAGACRLCLSAAPREAPQVAPNFCMLLRKHLQNAEVLSVSQVGFERIIKIDFEHISEFEEERLSLYSEIMGKYSNAVLVKDGVILGALKVNPIAENTKRFLFPGAKYALPEPQNKVSPFDDEGLLRLEFSGGDLAEFIADNILGIAYVTARDIADFCGGKYDAELIKRYILGGQSSPAVVFRDGEPVDFKANYQGADCVKYPTVLKAQAAFYDEVLSRKSREVFTRTLLSAISSAVKKYEKRLAQIEEKLSECRDMERVKLKGELITANLYAIRRGDEVFEAVNYYDEAGGKIKIALDKSLTPSQNAQKYYRRYAKLKRTAEAAGEQKAEVLNKLDYLYSIRAHAETADGNGDLDEVKEELELCGILKKQTAGKKKRADSAFRTFICGEFAIYAGRNNIQNDRLLKSAAPDDIWLHTQGYHSSHVIIACGSKKAPDGVLQTAAEICAHYSDGKSGSKIPVDYTRRKFVKKPPSSPAGFVIYTEYKTMLVDPDPHAELKKE